MPARPEPLRAWPSLQDSRFSCGDVAVPAEIDDCATTRASLAKEKPVSVEVIPCSASVGPWAAVAPAAPPKSAKSPSAKSSPKLTLPTSRFSKRAITSVKRASSSLKEDKQRKVERIDRWCAASQSRNGTMPLMPKFANVPATTRASELDEKQDRTGWVEAAPPQGRGHRRTQSAPVSASILQDLKKEVGDASRMSRCLSRCARRFSLGSVQLQRSTSLERFAK